jgi:hypothetical protein
MSRIIIKSTTDPNEKTDFTPFYLVTDQNICKPIGIIRTKELDPMLKHNEIKEIDSVEIIEKYNKPAHTILHVNVKNSRYYQFTR